MVDVTTETVIQRPIAIVSAYAADPGNAPAWYENIDSVEWLTAEPLQLGTRAAFQARFLGRVLNYVYEVVEYEPGARLVMRTASGPFPMETTYQWAPTGEGATRMTLRNRGMPSGFSKLVAPFLATSMRRANQKDLARIKSLLEGQATNGG